MNNKITVSVNYKKIGLRIREARLRLGLSQEDLGKAVGNLSPTAISLYEQGKRKVSIDVLSMIAKALHISFEELIEDYRDDIPPIQVSLRLDKELKGDQSAQQQILDFIEFIKQKRKKRNER